MAFSTNGMQKNCHKALISLFNLFESARSSILDKYFDFYRNYAKINSDNYDVKRDAFENKNVFYNFVMEIMDILSNSEKQRLIDFFMECTEFESDEDALELMKKAMYICN